MESEFKERLAQLLQGQSARSFAAKAGMADTTLRQYLYGRSEPNMSQLIKIAATAGVSIDWLATGEGAMHPRAPGAVAEHAPRYDDQDAAFLEEYALIDGYHISVSAGHGAFNDDHEVKRKLAFRRKWLSFRRLNPDHLAVVFAKGDSMEPTIHSGDSILIDLSQNQIQDGGLFVLRLSDELYAKRLQKRVDGGVNIISDNKAGYETLSVLPNELESLSIIGKVVWLGHDFF
ncbi:LexA family transcriptional regulator [Aeromonas caviae]|uniref:LexA family transcriptional regulator n=1 Tax=Aeromonas caviae TaxID=648 RepID=UPI000FEB912F|nr:helix-turn-helix transcriptional regulator [Aeromonas caviae]RWT79250.1 transcriptional regulator [Aeromonas caviae]